MQIILATANQGKIKELKEMLKEFEVVAYSDILEPFEIVEDGDTFAKNALIKARAIFKKLDPKVQKESIVLADDSGISLPILDGAPGVFSARYAGKRASDKENLQKLIDDIKALGLESTPAFYTASVALIASQGEWVGHGWMHGIVTTTPKGSNGFGYDPIFVPEGYQKSLGELDSTIKKKISHRSKAIENIKPLLNMLKTRLQS